MATLDDLKGTLPYASEILGVYQPLLGWRSRITKERFDDRRSALYQQVADRLMTSTQPSVVVEIDDSARDVSPTLRTLQDVKLKGLRPHQLWKTKQSYIASKIDSAVARLIQERLGEAPPDDWEPYVGFDAVSEMLRQVENIVPDPKALDRHPRVKEYLASYLQNSAARNDVKASFQSLFQRESAIAGYLVFLGTHHPNALPSMFYKNPKLDLHNLFLTEDPLLSFGANNYDAVLSPIGVVHLYRQYFFEFDSFLGPPVGHVWLSPGGTVELTEVNTRKVFTERSLEQLTETVRRSESQLTTQDELADAVKEENRANTKFGFSNVATYSSPVFQDTATASFSLDNEKSTARESTHKQMRQQSEKLSSEIKRSFKTTFRTSTEVTDTSSKRYVLQNTTKKLVNYELRRKMRKVGVQVQDIGVQLCWQTFVDDPARDLGISRLVHIAQPSELGDLQQPDGVPMPQPAQEEVTINIPFVGKDTEDRGIAYTRGTETEVGIADSTEHIEWRFPRSATFSQPGFTLARVELDPQGADVKLSCTDLTSVDGSSTGTFTVRLDYAHFHEQRSVSIKAVLIWEPSAGSSAAAATENAKRVAEFSAEKARRFKEAYFTAARERIKLASRIEPRPSEDLREEERTVVYRTLISQLMRVAPHQSKHVISELVRSIFDVEKMLYFVAPEWWEARLHRSGQVLGQPPSTGPLSVSPGANFVNPVAALPIGAVMNATAIPADHLVDWGGGRETGRDNYYITDESAPAKMGSSLGWLLQLDGDELRNAFLNSPWVKAVIPIRPGKEQAAINWLQQAHVEGSDGLGAAYVASADDPPELRSGPGHQVLIRDALTYLIGKMGEFNRKSRTPLTPNPFDAADPRNHFAGSLPSEAVFEHGFYPLRGGVRFDQDGTEQVVFSQWLEILPTEQVVALQIEYDPITLQAKVVEVDEGGEGDGDIVPV